MIEELKNLKLSQTYLQWMRYINGSTNAYLDPRNLINGFCEDVAYYLHTKYDIPIINISYFLPTEYRLHVGHFCVLHTNGLYYDGVNTDGVIDVWDLQWSKNVLYSNIGYSNLFKTIDIDYPYHDNWYLKHKPELLRILKGDFQHDT